MCWLLQCRNKGRFHLLQIDEVLHCSCSLLPLFDFTLKWTAKRLFKGCYWREVSWAVAAARAERKTTEALTAERFNWVRQWPLSVKSHMHVSGDRNQASGSFSWIVTSLNDVDQFCKVLQNPYLKTSDRSTFCCHFHLLLTLRTVKIGYF